MSSASAFQTTYRQEIINGFDKTVSVLRDTVVNEFMEKGGSAVFLVADTINQTARTRGINGLIPADPLALTQNTCTLVPWHKLVTVSDFNIFASQGNLQDPMKAAIMAAINRKIDDDIITILDTGSQVISAGGIATVAMIQKAKAILGIAKVPNDGNLTLLATPAMIGYLQQTAEFSNAQYVTARPYDTGKPSFGDMRMVYKWNGMTVIEDPTLPGIGTTAEHCYLYHKNAIGHAINKQGIETGLGYNEEQLYSWANSKTFIGSKLLQNSGIVVITHDGSAMVAG